MSDRVGEFLVIAMFIIPAIFALMSASKGKSQNTVTAQCEHCGSYIPASASVCPFCRRSSPFISKRGFSYYNKSKNKAESNSPMFRFIVTYVVVLVLEFIILGAIAAMVG